ncbi:unnamed protein product, partial [Porites lobata]
MLRKATPPPPQSRKRAVSDSRDKKSGIQAEPSTNSNNSNLTVTVLLSHSSLGSGLIGIEHDKNLNFGIEGQQMEKIIILSFVLLAC